MTVRWLVAPRARLDPARFASLGGLVWKYSSNALRTSAPPTARARTSPVVERDQARVISTHAYCHPDP